MYLCSPDLDPIISNMFLYLLGSYTREAMKSRKGLEAHNTFQSGWVQKVLCLNTADNTRVLTAKVLHSQRLSEDSLRPWVAIKKDGTVICAHCNCMAGYASFYSMRNFSKYFICLKHSVILVGRASCHQ